MLKPKQIDPLGSEEGSVIIRVSGQNIWSTLASSALKLPQGVSADRPVPASAGHIRFNENLNYLEFFDGVKWQPMNSTGLNVSAGTYGVVIVNTDGHVVSGYRHDFRIESNAQPSAAYIEVSSQSSGIPYYIIMEAIPNGNFYTKFSREGLFEGPKPYVWETKVPSAYIKIIGSAPGYPYDGVVELRSSGHSYFVVGGVGIDGSVGSNARFYLRSDTFAIYLSSVYFFATVSGPVSGNVYYRVGFDRQMTINRFSANPVMEISDNDLDGNAPLLNLSGAAFVDRRYFIYGNNLVKVAHKTSANQSVFKITNDSVLFPGTYLRFVNYGKKLHVGDTKNGSVTERTVFSFNAPNANNATRLETAGSAAWIYGFETSSETAPFFIRYQNSSVSQNALNIAPLSLSSDSFSIYLKTEEYMKMPASAGSKDYVVANTGSASGIKILNTVPREPNMIFGVLITAANTFSSVPTRLRFEQHYADSDYISLSGDSTFIFKKPGIFVMDIEQIWSVDTSSNTGTMCRVEFDLYSASVTDLFLDGFYFPSGNLSERKNFNVVFIRDITSAPKKFEIYGKSFPDGSGKVLTKVSNVDRKSYVKYIRLF